MSDIQEDLKQQLVEQAQQLEARGGPSALTTAARVVLHYEPVESWFYEGMMASRQQGETYYPLTAVLAALEYSDLHTLQEDWNEVLSQKGPLPLYLHPMANGDYSPMIAETVVLEYLIWLTEVCDAFMQAG